MGYTGAITIIKDYVAVQTRKKCSGGKSYETELGQQVQMDQGITHYIDERGNVHKTPVFVMILGHSRRKYVEFTKRCDKHTLFRCMVNAFT